MLRMRILVLLLILLVGVVGVQAQDLTDQTILLTFVPNIQFSPVYVAIEKGYFAEAGLNVTVEHLDEPDVVDLVASNQRQFGVVSGEQVILARFGQRPVVFVYEWFQQFPVGIAVPAGGEFTSVTDLAGHNVGIPGLFGASYSGVVALLAANDMTQTDVDLEPIGFNAAEVVCVGGVEAAVVYINNEPLQINQRAAAGECGDLTGVDVFPVSEAADLVSNGLIVNEETIANNPDLVQAVVTAFDRGLRDVINNPAEAYLLSASYVDNLPLSDDFRLALEGAAVAQNELLATNPPREIIAESRVVLGQILTEQFDPADVTQFIILLNTIDLWDADVLGYSELPSWEITQTTLQTMGFLDGEIDLEAAFTNTFVPGMMDEE